MWLLEVLGVSQPEGAVELDLLAPLKSPGFPGGSVVKNLPASAGDNSSIPGSDRSSGEGNGSPLHTLAWEIPWTEEPGGVQSWVTKRDDGVTKQQTQISGQIALRQRL